MLGASTPLESTTREDPKPGRKAVGEFWIQGRLDAQVVSRPGVVPELKEGAPTTKVSAENAVEFIIKAVRQITRVK